MPDQTENPRVATWQRAFVTLLLVYVCMAGYWSDALISMAGRGNVADFGLFLILGVIASLIGLVASWVLVSFLGVGILKSRYGFVLASVLLSLIALFVLARILTSIMMVT